MRSVLCLAAAAAICGPAFADEPSTLDYVTTKGVVMKVMGMDIDVAYTPDGKMTAFGGQVTGTWKRNGDTMCSTNSMDPNEACVVYPAGKKPGDVFELVGPQGPFTIIINK
jgi:glucose dehydrogenase